MKHPPKNFGADPINEALKNQWTDSERLDWIEANSYDLRCYNCPTGGDDYDIYWNVVSHHMAKPTEREVGQGGHTPRQAIDRAIAEEEK